MRTDFCAFILTHGRAENIYTLGTLDRANYSGKVYLVIDDEDEAGDRYRELYGDMVLTFNKDKVAESFDLGDNFTDHRGVVVYARNALFDLAKQVGCRYFIALDDDYTSFFYRFTDERTYDSLRIQDIDGVLNSMIEFMETVPRCTCIAMSQGGDHLGGAKGIYSKSIMFTRKAMNTFVCDTERPFTFVGRINEDVNTYTLEGTRGMLFFTFNAYQMTQVQTQSSAGGMTETYLDGGTYVKSFYTIIFSPSCVKIRDMGETNRRIHHRVSWNNAGPKILNISARKAF